MVDQRFESIHNRLLLLNNEQLQRIIDADICLDTYNYEASTGRFCGIAHGLDIPNKLVKMGVEPTQDIVRSMLEKEPAFGTVKSLPGQFYTTNRESDLKGLCKAILEERQCLMNTTKENQIAVSGTQNM